MIPDHYYPAKIIHNQAIGEHVRWLRLETDEVITPEPGQFFMLRLANAEGELVERSYSIANFSNGKIFEFVIRIEPEGRMSSLIPQLKTGDRVHLKGPFGRFGFIPQGALKLCLIAGGVGIAPIRSIIQKYAAQFKIQLFYGFRAHHDFLFEQELQSYGFELITNTGGYISDSLEGKIFAPDLATHTFICGPPPMVKATREKLFTLGFDRNHVHVEAW